MSNVSWIDFAAGAVAITTVTHAISGDLWAFAGAVWLLLWLSDCWREGRKR